MRVDVILEGALEGGSHEGRDQPVRATLDHLFRRAARARPDALALIDPPDRLSFTDGAPRRLTYAAADRAISALAARLRGFGLPTDSVVAIQLPNTVESVIALLGVLRAGLIAAPLPLLWRHGDAAAALTRVAARALIGCQRVGETLYGDIAMHIAMETFTIRFLCGFGEDLPDGMVPIDDVFATGGEPPRIERADAADHVALVTFDVTAEGIVPVARSHAELIAGGLAVHLEGRIEPHAVMLGALALASFAGLATTVVPWLLSGGTLVLHHPFTPAVFAAQCAEEKCAVAVLPGTVAMRLAEAGLMDDSGLHMALAVWRAPERLAGSAGWSGPSLVDVSIFGEIGLIPVRRGPDDKPGAPASGPLVLPHGTQGIHLLDVARSAAGTLVLSGPMVPHASFPPGGAPLLKAADGGIDTLYPCCANAETGALVIDGPPAGLVGVGGYRFALRSMQDHVTSIEDAATLAALPDLLAGHRLAGTAANRDAICDALLAQGANPLLVAAFRARKPPQDASAA